MSGRDPLYTRRDEKGNEIQEDRDCDQDTLEKARIVGRCRGSAGVDSRILSLFGDLKHLDSGGKQHG
jgi:hypothetical protein